MSHKYPDITDEEMKACKDSDICRKKPIGILFYVALVLITIGQCGHRIYLISKQEKEKRLDRQNAISRHTSCGQSWKDIWLELKRTWPEYIGLIVALFVLSQAGVNKRTRRYFITPACIFGGGCVLFILGKLCFYPFERPKKSAFTQVLCIIVLAFKKWLFNIKGAEVYCREVSLGANNLNKHGNDSDPQHVDSTDGQMHNISEVEGDRSTDEHGIDDNSRSENNGLTNKFRFLNRAARYDSSANLEVEIQQNRLYTVKTVEDAKLFVGAVILSLIFVTYGLMSSVSSTFFVEQANRMDRHIRFSKKNINVPVQIFVNISAITNHLLKDWCRKWYLNRIDNRDNRFHGALRMGLEMLLSVPCFAVAFSVEFCRLRTLKHKKNMSAFWLVPQLVLMGVMNGLAEYGLEDYFDNEIPQSLRKPYGSALLADGVKGIGKLLSIVLFTLVFELTKKNGRPGWFEDQLNDSHLDYYYIVIAVIALLSTITYAPVIKATLVSYFR